MIKQWLLRGRFEQKVMLCVCWIYKGLIYFEQVANGRGIIATVYSEEPERMYVFLA